MRKIDLYYIPFGKEVIMANSVDFNMLILIFYQILV